MKRRRFLTITAAVAAASLGVAAFSAFNSPPALANEPPPAVPKRLPIVWLVGDSTVNTNTGELRGWGKYLPAFFDLSRADVQNKARGGRSSRTFTEEGLWAAVRDQIQPGDFVLMQFGHNDGGRLGVPPNRASLPGVGDDTGTFDDPETKMPHLVHSFGWYMEQFVREAKAKGATPVVLSPVPRNMWSKDNKTVNRASKDYGAWAKAVAERNHVPFIDLNEIIAAHYETDGQAKVASVYFTTTDHTHTSATGAQLNAQSVVEGIREGAKTNSALLPLAALLCPTPAPFAPETKPVVMVIPYFNRGMNSRL